MEIDDAAPSYALLPPIFIYIHIRLYVLSYIYAIGSLVRLSMLPWLAQRFSVKEIVAPFVQSAFSSKLDRQNHRVFERRSGMDFRSRSAFRR